MKFYKAINRQTPSPLGEGWGEVLISSYTLFPCSNQGRVFYSLFPGLILFYILLLDVAFTEFF